MEGCDLRHTNLAGADFAGAALTGAKLHGASSQSAKWTSLAAEWLDASPSGDGTRQVRGEDLDALLSGKMAAPSHAARYFGKGDILRDASLEFGDGSSIEIESRFENCSITLGRGTDLVIGEAGVLSKCRIQGGGNITVLGQFFERESPGIIGPKRLVVTNSGAVVGSVEQAAGSTEFAFQPGCRLRMKILKSRTERSGSE
ncbi:MAG: pentapeptide repeat-containing protein [Polyangiaceae bacterium]